MGWPLSQDYNEAIQDAAACFSDPELKQGEVVCNALGLPVPCSGNFADVYAVQSGQRKWAVKCFTRQIPGLQERYVQISAYLKQVQLPFMVDFQFLDRGILVRGAWYPVLKMQWVEGFNFNTFVRDNLDKPALLQTLCQIWVRLAAKLREANFAHGDLQHGNVLLVPGSKAGMLGIKLVDYDGMCVPALELLKSIEVGHPAYQHPQRLKQGTYGLQIDRFSLLAIYTALRALIVGGKSLWSRFDTGDNLLFGPKDFEAPQQSAVFQELRKLRDPEVQKFVQILSQAAQQPIERVPHLADLVSDPTAITPQRKPTTVLPPRPATAKAEDVFAAATAGGAGKRKPRSKGGAMAWVAGVVSVVMLGACGLGGIFLWSVLGKPKDTGAPPTLVAQLDTGKTQRDSAPAKTAPRIEPQVPSKVEPKVLPQSEPKVFEPKVEPKVGPKVVPKVEPKADPVNPPDPEPGPGGLVRTLDGFDSPCHQVSVTRDGEKAFGVYDTGFVLWELESGRVISRLSIRGNTPKGGAISGEGDHTVIRSRGMCSIFSFGRNITNTAFRGVRGTINCVQFTADGRHVLVGGTRDGFDGDEPLATAYDFVTGMEVARFRGHRGPVTHLAIANDGLLALTASADLAAVWEVATGKEVWRLPKPPQVTAVALSSEERQALIASADRSIRVWNLDSKKEIRRLGPLPSAALSMAVTKDGRRALAGSGSERAGQAEDCLVRLWNLADGTEVRQFDCFTAPITTLAMPPDGRTFLAGSGSTVRVVPLAGINAPAVRRPDPKDKPVAPGKTVLEGNWRVSRHEANSHVLGEKIGNDLFAAGGADRPQYTFTDNKLVLRYGDNRLDLGTFRIDAKNQPATFDLTTPADGPFKGAVFLGIYTLEDTKFNLCLGGRSRPQDFDSGDGRFNLTLTRARP